MRRAPEKVDSSLKILQGDLHTSPNMPGCSAVDRVWIWVRERALAPFKRWIRRPRCSTKHDTAWTEVHDARPGRIRLRLTADYSANMLLQARDNTTEACLVRYGSLYQPAIDLSMGSGSLDLGN